MMICANCRLDITHAACVGESGIYSPERSFMLCDPCWIDEDEEIDRLGTNEIPERIERYQSNDPYGQYD